MIQYPFGYHPPVITSLPLVVRPAEKPETPKIICLTEPSVAVANTVVPLVI
jgi:hypothetical protein